MPASSANKKTKRLLLATNDYTTIANKTIPQLMALAALRVGDNVDKKNDSICMAKVKGQKRKTIIIQAGVCVKKPNPKANPAR